MLKKLAEKKQFKKAVAMLLVFTLTFANWMVLGEAIATSIQANLETQGTDTNVANVKFDAYFEEGTSKVHEISPKLDEEIILNLEVEVKEGYLKNAAVYLNGLGKNYEMKELESARLDLKQVNAGELLKQTIPLTFNMADTVNLTNLNSISTVEIEGTYVGKDGKEEQVEKTINLQISWTDEATLNITQEYTKYADYKTETVEGVILQSKVTVSRNEGTNLPVEKTNLEIKAEEITGKKLSKVTVSTINTSNTNGSKLEKVEFSEADWTYDDNTITITVANTEKNGEVWSGKGQDEFLITYVYENETETEDQTITATCDITARVKEYNKTEALTGALKEEKEVSKTDKTVSYEIKTNTQEINKGKLYANHIKETEKYEINYQTNWVINIPYAEIADVISLEAPEDTLFDKEDAKINKGNVSYYKVTKISKVNFDEILGENGYISILNREAEIARIDKNMQADENGYYIVTYTENYASLQIEISKPIAEGNVIILNEKKINNNVTFTDEEIVSLGKIGTGVNESTAQINFTEVNSGITVEIDKEELSSIAQNKDVNIKIVLNNKEENTIFYKEPTFDIILPDNIQSIDIKQVDVLYAEGLTKGQIQKGTVGGKPALRVNILGTQEDFSSSVFSNGTNIIIKADITLKELCPNKTEQIQVKYKNNNPVATMLGIDQGEEATQIKLTAPEEVISIQTIKTDDAGNEITSVDNGKVAGKLEIFADAKTKQMELKVLNNYTTPVGNIVILGRIPAEGNKTPEGIDLGSTFTTKLKTAVTSSVPEATIYYSENIEADKTLNENWKTEANIDLSTAKSYLIVFPEDYTLAPAESLSFTYDFEIPASLEHNSETYGAMTTYYSKIDGENKIAETAVAEAVGLSTGVGPQLKLELSANVEDGAVVREGQIIEYTANVTNTGKNVAENIVVTMKEVEKVDIKNSTLTIGNIEVGETKSVNFEGTISEILSVEDYYTSKGYVIDETGIYLEIKDTQTVKGKINGNVLVIENSELYKDYEVVDVEVIDETTGEVIVTMEKTTKEYVSELPAIYSKVTVEASAKDLSKNIVSNTISNKIKEVQINTNINATIKEEKIRPGEEFTYEISIAVKDKETLNNAQVEILAPEELEYTKIEILEVDSTDWANIKTTVINTIEKVTTTNGKVVIPISKLQKAKTSIIKIYAKVKENIVLDKVGKTVYNYANVYIANELESSTEKVGVEIAKDNIEITQECSNQNYYIKPTEKAVFKITVTNNGVLNTKATLQDIIPEILKVEKMTITQGNSSVESFPGNTIEDAITLKPGESIVYQIETSMKYIQETEVGEITNAATIIVNGVKSNSNSIKLYAEYVKEPENIDKPSKPDDGDNSGSTDSPEERKYRISGKAWLDENRNGRYEQEEQVLSDIEVYLINEAGDTISSTKTGNNGQYSFSSVEKGKYIVVFKYDNTVYNLTDYQKSGVGGNENSDVIGKEGTAITDTIEITDTSIGNIDMGLVTKETFDLRLDKYVSKIVVQTASGTKEYVQKDETKLTKVEIRAKEIKGAKVMMEYKIVITNEGKTAGYAKEIVDYMPKDTEFSSELNGGWYLGSDGNLHTSQLKDILIQPGESKTLTIVLSRSMTENNTDTINNRAEIAKSHNQDLVEDADSIAGNKANGEDDISSADVIIGVATGTEVIYITLVIISMIILGTGIYIIKRKVLER